MAILEWLDEGLDTRAGALVVYEDKLVPALIMEREFAAEVTALTTPGFLELAEAIGIIPSADAA